jgi:uncharacterized membrane protein
MDVSEEFITGKVIEVGETQTVNEYGFDEGVRTIKIISSEGELIQIEQPVNIYNESDNVVVKEGSRLVLVKTDVSGTSEYYIQEPYRLDGLFMLALIFVLMVVKIAGKKGFFAFIGLAVSALLLIKWLIPQILAGTNPVLISFCVSFVIATVTFYLSHGFKKSTTIALASTLFTLIIAFLLSLIVVHFIDLFGTGTEEAISLNFGEGVKIDLRGLFLGAIVIGTLGVLDDVTITQVSIVHELRDANSKLGVSELYKRALAVGKDHIASIINTLFLAYVGASFPLFILLVSMPRPFWVIMNSESMAEEIVRTLVGSMTLVTAIPIATLLAAYYYARKKSA